MKVSIGFIVVIIVLLLVALPRIWFWRNFDRVPIERVEGATAEARRNPLLGGARLLEGFGKEVASLPNLLEAPDVDGTLFLTASRRKLRDTLIEDLNTWVYHGGHLIVVAPSEDERDKDRILKSWNVTGREYVSGDDSAIDVQVDGWDKSLTVQFFYAFHLNDQDDLPDGRVESSDGIHALTSSQGAGLVTVLSDHTFATNAYIDEYDNAAFLWHLVSLNQGRHVWLVRGADAPSLWDYLRERAWMVMASMAILIVVVIWSSCRRFGPLIPNEPLRRRRLLEHIEASGRFLWRYRQSEELLHAVQASLMRSLEFRHPGWAASDDLHRKLAQASGFTQKDIMMALTQREVREEHAFTQTVKTLELIRNRL